MLNSVHPFHRVRQALVKADSFTLDAEVSLHPLLPSPSLCFALTRSLLSDNNPPQTTVHATWGKHNWLLACLPACLRVASQALSCMALIEKCSSALIGLLKEPDSDLTRTPKWTPPWLWQHKTGHYEFMSMLLQITFTLLIVTSRCLYLDTRCNTLISLFHSIITDECRYIDYVPPLQHHNHTLSSCHGSSQE